MASATRSSCAPTLTERRYKALQALLRANDLE